MIVWQRDVDFRLGSQNTKKIINIKTLKNSFFKLVEIQSVVVFYVNLLFSLFSQKFKFQSILKIISLIFPVNNKVKVGFQNGLRSKYDRLSVLLVATVVLYLQMHLSPNMYIRIKISSFLCQKSRKYIICGKNVLESNFNFLNFKLTRTYQY